MTATARRIGRRRLLQTGAAVLAAPAIAQKGWPNRPVKLIIPFPPGGASDFIARAFADKLGQAFGQPFVLDNRGGASGAIGVESVVRAAPDGHTLLQTSNAPITIVPQLHKVNYDPAKDLLPIARSGDLVSGFVINSNQGIGTLPELVAYARKNPGKLVYGSAGLGTATHMRIEMLTLRAGIDVLHVPYRGSAEALSDVLAGNIQMMNEIIVFPHVKAGKLKLLVMNYPTRHPDYPDTPTLTESGFLNSDVPIWYSWHAPAGTSPEIIGELNAKIAEIAKSSEMIQRMREINVVVPTQTPAEISAFYAADIRTTGELIREAKIKLD